MYFQLGFTIEDIYCQLANDNIIGQPQFVWTRCLSFELAASDWLLTETSRFLHPRASFLFVIPERGRNNFNLTFPPRGVA